MREPRRSRESIKNCQCDSSIQGYRAESIFTSTARTYIGSTMKVGEHGPDVASLRALIDSLPALIHTGRPDGYLDFFNQRWLEFVGLRLEELEGWEWTAAGHREDVAELVARWR